MATTLATPRRRRVAVTEPTADCLTCENATVRVEGERLKIFCGLRHRSAVGCPDVVEDARSTELLKAIVRRVRRTQVGYRRVFNVIQPDCPNCKQNCCTRPFLKKTPFYGEDAIYYLLIGQPLPDVPRGADHCVFFDQGCTLPSHLRPHVCIEYKCPFVDNPPEIDTLGGRMSEDVIYLIAVATREYAGWRGVYRERDERGRATGATVDRFQHQWDPDDPLADLEERYGLAARSRRAES
jgi:hypothetical protein